MARVKTAKITRKKHKKVLKMAKGYYGAKSIRFRMANQAVMKSLQYAYVGRRLKKRDFRKLWITRINAACRMNDISYSKFINGLNIAGVTINRKMLSEIAIDSEEAFSDLVKVAKDALNGNLKEEKVVKTSTKKETTKKEAKKEETKDLSKLTVAELKEMAKAKKIEGISSMKKADLINALK